MPLSADDFNKIALGVSGLVSGLGLVLGGAFALYKYIEFENRGLEIELMKAEAEVGEQVSLSFDTTVTPMSASLSEYIGDKSICQHLPESQQRACNTLASSSGQHRAESASCDQTPGSELYPKSTDWFTVSHSIPFNNHSAVPVRVAVQRLQILQAGDLKIAPNTNTKDLVPVSLTSMASINSPDAFFLGVTSALIGSGYQKQFGSVYRLPVDFGCSEVSRTLMFYVDVEVTSTADESSSNLIHLISMCTLTRRPPQTISAGFEGLEGAERLTTDCSRSENLPFAPVLVEPMEVDEPLLGHP